MEIIIVTWSKVNGSNIPKSKIEWNAMQLYEIEKGNWKNEDEKWNWKMTGRSDLKTT